MDAVFVIKIFIFIYGLLIGSFLNVVIHRLPLGQSVVTPRSSCPKCGHKIKWYENLPVVSYLSLKGKCSNCGTKISMRYPLIELFVGFIAYFLAPDVIEINAFLNFTVQFSIAAAFVAHFFIDIEHQLLPDKINLFLLAIILPYSIFSFSFYHWFLGGILGFVIPYSITELFYRLRGVIGLGGGDIKLFGILGIYLGPLGFLNNIFMSCFLGSIIGVGLILSKKQGRDVPFAFGPFIIVCAAAQIYFPEWVEILNPLYVK